MNRFPTLQLPATLVPAHPPQHQLHQPTHLNQVSQIQQKIESDPILAQEIKACDDNFRVDEACCYRYLCANQWNVDHAVAGIRNTLRWRSETRPHKIGTDIKTHGRTPKILNHGFSTQGHPVLYLVPRFENSDDEDAQFMYVLFHMELAVRRMPDGIHQLVLIIDLSGVGKSGGASVQQSKRIIQMLSHHYPERLYRAFMVNAPWYYNPIWKLVSMFIDPATRSKMLFVPLPKTTSPTNTDSGTDCATHTSSSPWEIMMSEVDQRDFLFGLVGNTKGPDLFLYDSDKYFQSVQQYLEDQTSNSP